MSTTKVTFLLVTIGLFAACVASSGASGQPTLGTVSTLAVGRTIPNASITMAPPAAKQVAAIQAKDALTACTSGVASCPDGPATAELAVATDTASGRADAAGNVTLLMDHRLVWALSWNNVQCSHSGPPPAPGASVGSRLTACDVVVFVDATSGALLYTLSYAHQ